MRAITLWQPWASAIAYGHKRIETRGWRPSEKVIGECRPIAIHAAQRIDFGGVPNSVRGLLAIPSFPTGAIIAIADIRCVLPVEDALERFGYLEHERALGDFSEGRWGWVLSGIRRLTAPLFIGGRQGIWKVPDRYDETIADLARRGTGVNVG